MLIAPLTTESTMMAARRQEGRDLVDSGIPPFNVGNSLVSIADLRMTH